jgi:BioD-like phosphotransacetylase family protein
MPALLLISDRALAGKTTIALGLAQKVRSAGHTVALERLGGDAHQQADGALFAKFTSGQEPSAADLVIKEAAAGPPAEALDSDPDARVVVVADAGTPLAGAAACCNAAAGRLVGLVLNRAPARRAARLAQSAAEQGLPLIALIPEDLVLASPTLGEVARALNSQPLFLDSQADHPIDNTLIASISADPAYGYFVHHEANAVIVRSDKPDLQLAALSAGAACLIVTGGLPILHYVMERAEADEVPIIPTALDTIQTVRIIEEMYAATPFSGSREKLARLAALLADVDISALMPARSPRR